MTVIASQLFYDEVKPMVFFILYAFVVTFIFNINLNNPIIPAIYIYIVLFSSLSLNYFSLKHKYILIETLNIQKKIILDKGLELEVQRAKSFNSSKLALLGEWPVE